jgi:hypothetical protein
MIIKAATQLTYPIYHKYFLFNLVQAKRSAWQGLFLLILGPLLLLGFVYQYVNDPTDPVNRFGTILLALICAALYAVVFILPRFLFRRRSRQPARPDHFTFTEARIEASSGEEPGASGTSVTATPYELIYRAFETRDYFYIYVSLDQVYIICKNDITEGSAEDLRELLQTKLRIRFQVVPRA